MNNFKKFMENRKRKREENIIYHKNISELKETEKINLNELVSDMRLFKESRWAKISHVFSSQNYCWILLYRGGNNNLIRKFPMPRPFVVDISGKWHLFSPKAFRYVNKEAMLEFYEGNPFAILHIVNNKFGVPSLDTDAFDSVQKSKFIQDAVTVDDDKDINWVMIVVIIISVIAVIVGFVNISMIMKIMKAMNIK